MLIRYINKKHNFIGKFSSNQRYIDLDLKYVCHNYGPLPIVIEKGERCFVWDVEGKKYFDFMAGIGCTNQGHCHPKIIKALIDQAQKLTQTSRAFHNNKMGEFAEYLCSLLGYDKFLPSSSGVEACESACKLARRWGYVIKNVQQNKASILMTNGCFWGRSITASGGSDDPIRYTNFGPFTPGFPLVDYNDLNQIEQYLQTDPNCVAVMVEPIQGESGAIIPQRNYLGKIKSLCQKYDVLLIADEVQTGFGRTGKLMGHEWDFENEQKPDILTLGKAITGGVTPVSGIVADNHIMMTIKPGDHGSTYGGNPLGMACAKAAVEVLIEEKMVENSLVMGQILDRRLREVKFSFIKEIRSRGLMIGLEFNSNIKKNANDFSKILMKNGLLAKASKNYIMKFTPALVMTEKETNQAADILIHSLNQFQESGL